VGELRRSQIDNAAPDADNRGSKRFKKRELQRRKAQQRRRVLTLAAVAVAATAVAAAVIMAAAPVVQPPLEPGVIISNNAMHIHPHLTILNDGTEVPLPGNVGLNGGVWASHDLDHYLDPNHGATGQLSPLHTHDSSGDIHVEASVTRGFTLGEFFEVWGQPLGPAETLYFQADANHRLSLTVNGQPSGLWENVVFQDKQQIVISYTTI